MRSIKRKSWILLAIAALVSGVVALVLRQRVIAEQVPIEQVNTGKATQSAYRQTAFWRIYDYIAATLDHTIGWDKVPTPLGLAILLGLRNILRQQNLYDTTLEPAINQ